MANTVKAAQTISNEWVEGFVERWLGAFNSRQPEQVLELMTSDVIYDDSARPQTMHGHAEVREFLEFLWRAFPDFCVEAVDGPLVSADGKRSAFWWRSRMTNTGPINPPGMPATNKLVEYEGADFHTYRDGKVARLQIVFDMANISRQLGLLPGPGSLAERVMVAAQQLRARVGRS
jgi:steroid delta-isomerase-like uncharacterized protein